MGDVESLVLEPLRLVRAVVGDPRVDMREMKVRLGIVEAQPAGRPGRRDHAGDRAGRIERRLGPAGA